MNKKHRLKTMIHEGKFWFYTKDNVTMTKGKCFAEIIFFLTLSNDIQVYNYLAYLSVLLIISTELKSLLGSYYSEFSGE